MWISPTAGVTPKVFGISSSRAVRINLGAITKPASAYNPISTAMIPTMRNVLVFAICSTRTSCPYAAHATQAPSLAKLRSTLVALNQPLALSDLAVGQDIALARKRVFFSLEDDPNRRTHQI